MGYISPASYYKLLHTLSYKHNYPLETIYNMYPFERDIFIELVHRDLSKKEGE